MLTITVGYDFSGQHYSLRFYATEFRKVWKMLGRWRQLGVITFYESYFVYHCSLVHTIRKILSTHYNLTAEGFIVWRRLLEELARIEKKYEYVI